MDIKVVNSETGAEESTLKLQDKVFGCEFNEPLVHQVVIAQMAAARAGTKAQKSRSDVSGGGAKPWRQKGTGRARSGTSRSPIWRSGGVTFAARPRDYSQKVNKKMYRGALRSLLSELIRRELLIACNDFVVKAPKTKEMITRLQQLKLNDVLIVTDNVDENLYLAARNLHKVVVTDAAGVNPADLLRFEKIVMTVPVLKKFEEMLG